MNTRIRTILAFCLLVFSAAVIAQPPPYSGDRRQPHVPTEAEREAARKEIGIRVDQQERLERLYADADKKKKAIGDQLRDLYRQRHELFDNYALDRTREKELRRKIAENHNKLLEIQFSTEAELRNILKPDQFDRLRAALKNQRQNRPPGFGHHGPGDRDGFRNDRRP